MLHFDTVRLRLPVAPWICTSALLNKSAVARGACHCQGSAGKKSEAELNFVVVGGLVREKHRFVRIGKFPLSSALLKTKCAI
jgi:hypothetical protein